MGGCTRRISIIGVVLQYTDTIRREIFFHPGGVLIRVGVKKTFRYSNVFLTPTDTIFPVWRNLFLAGGINRLGEKRCDLSEVRTIRRISLSEIVDFSCGSHGYREAYPEGKRFRADRAIFRPIGPGYVARTW